MYLYGFNYLQMPKKNKGTNMLLKKWICMKHKLNLTIRVDWMSMVNKSYFVYIAC